MRSGLNGICPGVPLTSPPLGAVICIEYGRAVVEKIANRLVPSPL